ncbi:MAG: heme A synthase [Spirulina sp. SIO3F2]|nr:heme A synthase [Spirulina sp. SIO3F2]
MTESLFPPASAVQSATPAPVQVWVRRLIWKIAIATLALMAVGSATRVMNAGLACPDWPLCYGQLVPTQQMNLQVFLEWFHRLDASLVGISAIALLGISVGWRQLLPRWLPWAAAVALSLIVFQGVLGGLTVIQLLRFDIVTAHLGTALLFFCTLLVMGTTLLPPSPAQAMGRALPWLSSLAAVLVYGQSLLGALVGSQWALHQCFGINQLCTVMNGHILGVGPPTLTILALGIYVSRSPQFTSTVRSLTAIAIALLGSQIVLGVATFRLHLQVEPLTVTHQLVGASLLGVLVILATLAWRDRLRTITLIANAQS